MIKVGWYMAGRMGPFSISFRLTQESYSGGIIRLIDAVASLYYQLQDLVERHCDAKIMNLSYDKFIYETIVRL